MAILPIHIYGCDVLKKKTKPVKDLDDNKVKLIMDMFETLKNANGLGLSANQVGISSALTVLDLSSVSKNDKEDEVLVTEEYRKPIILFNPEIVKSWDEFTMEEGCLSIPELRAEVTRPDFIRLKFRDSNLNEQVIEVGGLLSRVIQHELDHLNGKLFVERLGKIKNVTIKKKLKKIQSGDIRAKYPVILK